MAERTPRFNCTAAAERNDGLLRKRPSVNWQDGLPSAPAPMHDDNLRRLVDLLDHDQRHMVERVYFGGATIRGAGAEIELTPAQAGVVLRQALARLRRWLEKRQPKGDRGRRRERCRVKNDSRRAWETLDPAALSATMNGRYRGDDRRLDNYVLPKGPEEE